jgi:hypothetical protein
MFPISIKNDHYRFWIVCKIVDYFKSHMSKQGEALTQHKINSQLLEWWH